MGVIARGFKNAFRNSLRTISITIILAISIGMALVMLMAYKTVQTKINDVKGSIGNNITVSPAGIRGFEGGGNLLTTTDVSTIAGLANVTKTVSSFESRLTPSTDTNLVSAIEPGSFGNRQRQSGTGGNSDSTNAPSDSGNFTMPIMATGTSDLSITSNLNASQFKITSGSQFNTNTSDNVALVGQDLATKNSLAVGSTFQAYGKDIKVVGIFDAGNQFANAGLIFPLKTLQTLSSQSGQISSIIVQTNSIDSVSSVESAIKSQLGSKADVVSQQDSSNNAVAPLQNIKTISLYSLIGSLVAGAVIILLTMVMIVRERRREIGVLKAIGASNGIIVSQFVVESLVLTLMSSVLGIILGLALSNPILNVLVNNSQSSTQSVTGGGGRGFGGGAGGAIARFGGNFAGGARNALTSLHAVVGTNIILYGLLAAVAIAIIGSAIPAFAIAKIRPAEVMRSE